MENGHFDFFCGLRVCVWVGVDVCDFAFSVGWRGYLSFLFSFFVYLFLLLLLFCLVFYFRKQSVWIVVYSFKKKLYFVVVVLFFCCHSKITQFVDHRFCCCCWSKCNASNIFIFSLLNCVYHQRFLFNRLPKNHTEKPNWKKNIKNECLAKQETANV